MESAGIEQLIGRLRDQGIAQGRNQAEALVTAAQQQAADIVAAAQREAEAVLVKAKEESRKTESRRRRCHSPGHARHHSVDGR